jgi:hypothetical protein
MATSLAAPPQPGNGWLVFYHFGVNWGIPTTSAGLLPATRVPMRVAGRETVLDGHNSVPVGTLYGGTAEGNRRVHQFELDFSQSLACFSSLVKQPVESAHKRDYFAVKR